MEGSNTNDDSSSVNVFSQSGLNSDDSDKGLLDIGDDFNSAQFLQLPGIANEGNLDPASILPSHDDKGSCYSIVTSSDTAKSPKVLMSVNINLFKIATRGMRVPIIPALSKPTFIPSQEGDHFVVGTEEQDPTLANQNFLIFSSLDASSVTVRFTYPIPDYVRDMLWIDPQHIVIATNHKLGLIRVSEEVNVEETVMFPEFHKDAIREIAANSRANRNLIISGGFDGNVFVTDISKLVHDIRGNQKKSENSLYPCKEVVSSVNWHPEDGYLASCTTDSGFLHIFDIRTDKRRPAVIHDTEKKELFCHSYRDSNTLMMGFGDASVFMFDMRQRRTFSTFVDPHQTQIGEIRFDHHTKNFAVFGVPQFTLWSYDDNGLYLNAHHQLVDSSSIANANSYHPPNSGYKTSGEFRRGSRFLGVTDSCGTFSLYDFSQNQI